MYRFHRCQPHTKCPNLTGWYLELRPDDADTLMKVHRGVVNLYFFKYGMDPHIQEDETRRALYHWAKLGGIWLMTVERFLLSGETILVNCNGGTMPMEGAIILQTIESDRLNWDIQFDGEIITLSRWPQAKHWYLSSNKDRIFIPAKYNELSEARKAALRYVPADCIRVKENSGALPPE